VQQPVVIAVFASRTADRRCHEIAGLQIRDVGADGGNATDALVADDEKIATRRRFAVEPGVNLLVGAVDTHMNRFKEDAAAIRYFIERGLRHIVAQMGAVRCGR